ncbi:hypothetical protein P308_22585 [Pseudomonas piscis]|nr:hypothetical protein P308_22585 [Pseudomonas piscis]
MPSTPLPAQRRFPLHIHISVMFTLLLLMTGVILGIYNYHATTRIILGSSEKLFQRIEQDVRSDLRSTYEPIRHVLSLLATRSATQAPSLEQRLELLRPFSQSLLDNSDLASLYLGYANGDFFMVRPLRDAQIRDKRQAPANSAYEVWSIERDASAGQVKSQSLFYDANLVLLERLEHSDERYDPRTRDWFVNARGNTDQITTRPYVFYSTLNVGTTLARSSGKMAVIAADLTLEQLSSTLAKHRVTPTTEVALLDDLGNVVAYPESHKLLLEQRSARLIKGSDLSPALDALLQGRTEGGHLQAQGRNWIVASSHIAEGGPGGLQLDLLVPEDELLADAYRLRWQGALITLTTLLLCLPLGWLISRILVRPLRNLVQEADAIRSFDFHYPASRRSPVLEVDQLSVSMTRMKSTLASFFEINASLSAQTRFDPLLQRVLFETVKIAQAQAGLIYLCESKGSRLEPHGLIIDGQPQDLSSFDIATQDLAAPHNPDWLRQLADHDNVVTTLGFEQAGQLQRILLALDSPSTHLVGIRLRNRHHETVGMLLLFLVDSGTEADLDKLSPDRIAFIQAVSATAALCIESQRLQNKQKQLLDSFIQLLAGAIDARAPIPAGIASACRH